MCARVQQHIAHTPKLFINTSPIHLIPLHTPIKRQIYKFLIIISEFANFIKLKSLSNHNTIWIFVLCTILVYITQDGIPRDREHFQCCLLNWWPWFHDIYNNATQTATIWRSRFRSCFRETCGVGVLSGRLFTILYVTMYSCNVACSFELPDESEACAWYAVAFEWNECKSRCDDDDESWRIENFSYLEIIISWWDGRCVCWFMYIPTRVGIWREYLKSEIKMRWALVIRKP